MRQLGTIIGIAAILGAGSALAVVQNGTGGGASANASNSPAQRCFDEGIKPGEGNAFGKCVSEKASAFGKCVSGAAGPGVRNPTEACEGLKPGNGNGNGADVEGPPVELSGPPDQSEQVPEYATAPESDTSGNGTGGVAAPSN